VELNGYTYEDIRSEIGRAMEEKSAAFFPALFPEVPSWDSFLAHLDKRRFEGEPFFEPNNPKEVLVGNVIKRTDADFYFYTTGGELTDDIPEVGAVKSKLQEICGDMLDGGPHPVGCFYNFAREGFNVPAHGDDRETFFWQCIGRTTWNIYNPNGKGMEWERIGSFDMGPGDLLYIGHWVEHEVLITGPRAGVAFNAKA